MNVHLLDGTYELFRHFFGVPPSTDIDGEEISAVRGVLRSVLSMVTRGATHIGVATDHVIESFRNDLYAGYKTGEGIEPTLLSQFPLLEDYLEAMGVVVWRMVEFEADDGLAAAAEKAAADARVDQIIICTPDKDLGQCIIGDRVVQLDRRRDITLNDVEFTKKFKVKPESMPDYLALVGDTADGFPGIAGWGAVAASTVLMAYGHLENIPKDPSRWEPQIRGSKKLADILFNSWEDVMLFKKLATLRTDIDLFHDIDELKWAGPKPEFEAVCKQIRADDLWKRSNELANARR